MTDEDRDDERRSTAVTLIIDERLRQVQVEGFHGNHDDEFNRYGELAQAAACYAAPHWPMLGCVPLLWPWLPEWWKPTTRRRDLIIAGALILTELERLERADCDRADRALDAAF